jgi:hypothetical protein
MNRACTRASPAACHVGRRGSRKASGFANVLCTVSSAAPLLPRRHADRITASPLLAGPSARRCATFVESLSKTTETAAPVDATCFDVNSIPACGRGREFHLRDARSTTAYGFGFILADGRFNEKRARQGGIRHLGRVKHTHAASFPRRLRCNLHRAGLSEEL